MIQIIMFFPVWKFLHVSLLSLIRIPVYNVYKVSKVHNVFPTLNILAADDKVSQLRGQRQPFHSPLLVKNELPLFSKLHQSDFELIFHLFTLFQPDFELIFHLFTLFQSDVELIFHFFTFFSLTLSEFFIFILFQSDFELIYHLYTLFQSDFKLVFHFYIFSVRL